MSGDVSEYKTYNERIVGILDNCGFFDESANQCAIRLQHDMEFYTSDRFTCMVTTTFPVSVWRTWSGEATRYNYYGVCGLKTTNAINGSILQQSCSRAAQYCGNNVTCVRDRVVDWANSGSYRFCPYTEFDLMVNPYPGEVAYKGYNGATVWNGSVYCTGYCTG